MNPIKKIHHVALVVADIEEALGFWRDSLGIPLDHIQEVPQEESAVAFLPVGDSEIELVQPTADGSGIARYLEKRGPGMHHLCLEVANIGTVLSGLKDRGIQLIHENPVVGESGRKYAFIHPKAANGVLVELYELPVEAGGEFPILETPRLTLREFTIADAADVFEMYVREDLVKWLGHETMTTLDQAEERVTSRISLFKRGWGCRWAITLKENPDKVIGSCGYFSVRVRTHTVEIGFDLHPTYWRKGFMEEALRTVLSYSFGEAGFMPVFRVEAIVDPRNLASIALLEKLGFQEEGLRRGFGYWKGAYQDVKMFALLKAEWLNSKVSEGST
jgi:methylmalonyl-CoA/ethylmalonyl-CoA epimerase